MHRLLLALAVTGCWTSSSAPPPEQPKQAKIKDLVQPVKIEKQEVVEEGGEEGGDPCGVAGGVVGGVVGGVPGGTVAPPPPPPPSAPPQNVAPTLLEGNRIAGNRNIIPNDVTKVEIMQAGKTKIIGSWKLCIADTGDVTSVTRLKSSGFADYDRKIETEMRTTWRYRPYQINGRAVPVCTAVTYIYSQAAPTPPPKP